MRLPCPGTGLGVRRPCRSGPGGLCPADTQEDNKASARGGWSGAGAGKQWPCKPGPGPPASPWVPETQVPPASLGHQLVSPVSPRPRSAPRCSALCIRLAAVEDFRALVVTLHCFWAAFPLISFSFEILSSPSSELTGPFISKAAASRRAADSCVESSGFLPPCFLGQGWETGECLHFAAAELSEPQS